MHDIRVIGCGYMTQIFLSLYNNIQNLLCSVNKIKCLILSFSPANFCCQPTTASFETCIFCTEGLICCLLISAVLRPVLEITGIPVVRDDQKKNCPDNHFSVKLKAWLSEENNAR